jgi:citrate synthase
VAQVREAWSRPGAGTRHVRPPYELPGTPTRWTRCAPPSPCGARGAGRTGRPRSTRPGNSPRSRPRRWPRFHRLRQGLEPVAPNQKLSLAGGFLQQLTGEDPDPANARALDAYFIVGAEHGLNASTFTCRVIISTRSDLASAICGAIGALKGPLHGGAPAEVVSQLHEIGSPDHAEKWVREAIERGDRIMGFGHRVYRAYDPRAAALRKVAEGMSDMAEWLDVAVKVEDVVLRVFGELKPDRVIKTNVEYYAAAVLQGVGLPPDLFPPTFALARMAGWGAHAIEQASADKLIRPDARYVGPAEMDVPALGH